MSGKFLKKAMLAVLAVAAAGSVLMLAGCGSNGTADSGSASSGSSDASQSAGTISVYSREDGSGTRGAFVELLGIEQKNDKGEKVDLTTTSAVVTNSTSVMLTSVAGDPAGIGYVSLGSLNDSVKAIKVDGVDISAKTVKDGSYPVARPFNVVTKDSGKLSEPAQDFLDYILSSDGQTIVADNGFIQLDGGKAYKKGSAKGKVVVAGSSSVTPVMEKLAESYQKENPDVTIEVQQSDSTTGIQMAGDGTCDLGMASRDLKDSESGVKATVIAKDGIAVVVSPENKVSDLTSQQICDIYTGTVTSWDEVA